MALKTFSVGGRLAFKCYWLDSSSITYGNIEESFNKIVTENAQYYIWNESKPVLSEGICHKETQDSDDACCAEGVLHYGDNVDDEWFLVFILLKLTSKHNMVCVSVEDEDGQFMLIEAADHLSSWMEPQTTTNRVFLCHGNIHIIPLPQTPSEITLYPSSTPSIQKAVDLVLSDVVNTEASSAIQNLIINKAKSCSKQLLHKMRCCIPVFVANVLKVQPDLIATIVNAFCSRSETDSKVSMMTMENNSCFEGLTFSRVSFTRFLYAKLLQQNLKPPRRSIWKTPQTTSSQFKAITIGYKLALGFEIVRNQEKSQSFLRSNDCWPQYLDSLKQNGYFLGELEGSQLYDRRTKMAKKHFDEMVEDNREKTNTINSIMSHVSHLDATDVPNDKEPDDDDSWLEMSPSDVERLLLNQWPSDTSSAESQYVEGMDSVVNGFKSFVDDMSGYDGIDADMPHPQQQDEDNIDFKPSEFMSAMERILSISSDTDSDSSISDDEIRDSTCKVDVSPRDISYAAVVNTMDHELSTSITKATNERQQSPNDEVEDDDVLDVDTNLVKNFLESFASQEGLSGPVSNILNSIGLSLPPMKS